MRVTPAGEPLWAGEMLLGHIQAAGVPDTAVDHRNLPMVPVAQCVQLVQGGKRKDLDSAPPERSHIPSSQHEEATDGVIQNADLHP